MSIVHCASQVLQKQPSCCSVLLHLKPPESQLHGNACPIASTAINAFSVLFRICLSALLSSLFTVLVPFLLPLYPLPVLVPVPVPLALPVALPNLCRVRGPRLFVERFQKRTSLLQRYGIYFASGFSVVHAITAPKLGRYDACCNEFQRRCWTYVV